MKNRFRQRQYLCCRYLYGSFKLKIATRTSVFFTVSKFLGNSVHGLNRAPDWNVLSSTWHQKSEENVELNFDELKEVTWDVESVEEAVPVGALPPSSRVRSSRTSLARLSPFPLLRPPATQASWSQYSLTPNLICTRNQIQHR